jgi:hypothetical protein
METITTTKKFAVELLVTDTLCWEVVAGTEKTLTLRLMSRGEVTSTTGGPYPVVHTEALADEDGYTVTVRLRKDGTYRIAGGNPIHFTDSPSFRTDYSF